MVFSGSDFCGFCSPKGPICLFFCLFLSLKHFGLLPLITDALRPIYTVRFCRMQPPYDTKKSRRILKHALKPYDNRGLKCVVSVS